MPSAGTLHSILLKSDGTAAAFGSHRHDQCYIPGPPEGITYTQVAAGGWDTVLLKSDGTAVAFGENGDGQCNIQGPPEGITYTQVAAGDEHTVLLKSDGTAAAFGGNYHGQCNIPALADGVKYTSNEGMPRTVLSLHFGNGYAAFCLLNGEERLRIEVNAADSFSDLRLRYVKGMEGAHGRFNVVLPTGTLLDKICMQTPSASVEPWLPRKRATPSE